MKMKAEEADRMNKITEFEKAWVHTVYISLCY